MIIDCPHCRTRYQYDEDRFERKPSKKIRCARCQQVFQIENPAFAAPAAPLITADETTFRGKVGRPPGVTKKKRSQSTDTTLRMPEAWRYSVAVINGPDAGMVFRLETPRVVIGRQGAEIVLSDSEVSRAHALIEIRDTVVTLDDLDSTNGTFVEGQRLQAPRELHNHLEFVVGNTTLMLIVTEHE